MGLPKQDTDGRPHPAVRVDSGTSVAEIVSGILDAVRDGAFCVDPELLDELEAASGFSSTADGRLEEPVALADIPGTHVPAAEDELDAVVGETETAANVIMAAVEQIDRLTETLDAETVEKIAEQVMNIYQACSFQDITGQRIFKVREILKDIEFNAISTLGSLGDEAARQRLGELAPARAQGLDRLGRDSGLLHGPQLEGGGNGQDEIDNILASFD